MPAARKLAFRWRVAAMATTKITWWDSGAILSPTSLRKATWAPRGSETTLRFDRRLRPRTIPETCLMLSATGSMRCRLRALEGRAIRTMFSLAVRHRSVHRSDRHLAHVSRPGRFETLPGFCENMSLWSRVKRYVFARGDRCQEEGLHQSPT